MLWMRGGIWSRSYITSEEELALVGCWIGDELNSVSIIGMDALRCAAMSQVSSRLSSKRLLSLVRTPLQRDYTNAVVQRLIGFVFAEIRMQGRMCHITVPLSCRGGTGTRLLISRCGSRSTCQRSSEGMTFAVETFSIATEHNYPEFVSAHLSNASATSTLTTPTATRELSNHHFMAYSRMVYGREDPGPLLCGGEPIDPPILIPQERHTCWLGSYIRCIRDNHKFWISFAPGTPLHGSYAFVVLPKDMFSKAFLTEDENYKQVDTFPSPELQNGLRQGTALFTEIRREKKGKWGCRMKIQKYAGAQAVFEGIVWIPRDMFVDVAYGKTPKRNNSAYPRTSSTPKTSNDMLALIRPKWREEGNPLSRADLRTLRWKGDGFKYTEEGRQTKVRVYGAGRHGVYRREKGDKDALAFIWFEKEFKREGRTLNVLQLKLDGEEGVLMSGFTHEHMGTFWGVFKRLEGFFKGIDYTR